MLSDFAKVSETRQTELYHLFHISKYYFNIYLRGRLRKTMEYLSPCIWCSPLNLLTVISDMNLHLHTVCVVYVCMCVCFLWHVMFMLVCVVYVHV